jgi:hypothetical protein
LAGLNYILADSCNALQEPEAYFSSSLWSNN